MPTRFVRSQDGWITMDGELRSRCFSTSIVVDNSAVGIVKFNNDQKSRRFVFDFEQQHRSGKMITVRKATPVDVATVVSYIEKKAAFDRSLGCFDGPLGTTTGRIAKALFEAPVFACALLAVSEEKPLGFAFYHFRFSSFQARPNIWLDDLFVDAGVRRSGAGVALMGVLATEAVVHDCTHIAWTADAKNPSGIPFYTKLSATLVAQNGSRLTYSIMPELLRRRVAEIIRPDQNYRSNV